MDKVDFKKSDALRARQGQFRVLDVPVTRYLMVDGRGDPNMSPEYAGALAALYPVGFTLKFASRRELGRDYVVPPLEGLWWADDMASFTTARDKSQWRWTMMLLVPEWVGPQLVADAIKQVRAKNAPARLEDVRCGELAEGLCVQTLHVGSFDDEGPVLERMHDVFFPEHALRPRGLHHEIYLSDARRVAPERMRTVLRQPVMSSVN